MENYLVYNLETGAIVMSGQGPAGFAKAQPMEEGLGVLIVPSQAVLKLGGIDMEIIKISYSASIDQDADRVRSTVITNTPGEIATYQEKEAEARAVLADPTARTIILTAEADATNRTVQDLAQEIVVLADEWRMINARINATRRVAKIAIKNAENLAQIGKAIQIDWRSVLDGE